MNDTAVKYLAEIKALIEDGEKALHDPHNFTVYRTNGVLAMVYAAVCQGLSAARKAQPGRPTIVCLCGSTRFWRTFQQAGLQETMAGRIVLSIGAASGTDDEHFGNLPREEYDRVKTMLDELHLAKVALADEVLILNVDGYIGESTRRELDHAIALGKRVRYWEPVEAAA